MSGMGSGVTPQKRAMARAVWGSWARARVGARLRCFDSARAVRPEWVATTRRAAFKRREIKLAASTTLSVIGWTRPARATSSSPRPADAAGQRRRASSRPTRSRALPVRTRENISVSASLAIRLIIATASTGY